MLFRFLYKATRSAKPTATSAAATVMIKNTNMLPSKLRAVREKFTSARLIPLSISSNYISRINRFLRSKAPKKPIAKRQRDGIR